MAVTSSGSAEFLSVSSIFSYDIYKTYIHPKVAPVLLAPGHCHDC